MAPVGRAPLTSASVQDKSFAPVKKDTKQIVQDELKRAKELEKLEAKHERGEISDFEYRVNKAAINLMYDLKADQIDRPPVMHGVA